MYRLLPGADAHFVAEGRRLVDGVEDELDVQSMLCGGQWLAVVEDRVDEQTLYHAQQAVAMTDYSSLPSLHTLATVYAELGRLAEARDVLLALVANRITNDLEPHDWYVLGRIAEQYGVPDAAIEAYERVEPPEEGTPESTSTFLLAQRGIARAREAAAKREPSPTSTD